MQNEKLKMENIGVLREPEKAYNIGHRCFYFSKSIIDFIRELTVEPAFKSIPEQLVRSATSIGANVVEGGSGSSRADFLKFLVIALKSANETKYWLCLIRDSFPYPDKAATAALIEEAVEISRIIATIILNAKGRFENEKRRSLR